MAENPSRPDAGDPPRPAPHPADRSVITSREPPRSAASCPPGSRPPKHCRPGVAIASAAIALSAIGGAIGLIGGGADLGERITERLPLQSPALGGLALAVFVVVPFAAVSAHAWRGTPLTDQAAVAAGVVLVAWIIVQLAFIRTLSPLQPVCIAAGIGFVIVGRRGTTARRRRVSGGGRG